MKGFQLLLGLFTATCLALWRPQCLSSSRRAPVFPCVAKAMACTMLGRQKRSAQQGNRQEECALKKLLQHHAVSFCYGTSSRHVLPVWSHSRKACRHLIQKYLVCDCATLLKFLYGSFDASSYKMFDFFPSKRVTFLALLCCARNEGKCLMSHLVFNDSS